MSTVQQGNLSSKKAKRVTAGFEKIWSTAYALRGTTDVAQYKHDVMGLIFLKHMSDAFEECRFKLDSMHNANTEDPDEYRARNVFWVPPEGRWASIMAQSGQPTVGQVVDGAMTAIERENPAIKNVLPKNYSRPALDKARLGQIIVFISSIQACDEKSHSKDVLCTAYEYFLHRFANAQGRKGAEFSTPRSVTRLLVEMLQPHRGRVYDPCCGSAGMLVQSIEFICAHGNKGRQEKNKKRPEISVYGQESNHATWQLARMNLAMRGIDSTMIAYGDSFHNDQYPDLKADFILANPPFNIPGWGGKLLQDDRRWIHGAPPDGNANFAWVQHVAYHLAPFGTAGFVLGNRSMSSKHSGEGEIRKSLIEANLVDCMVALPGQLFYSTQIPACMWFLSKGRAHGSQKDSVLFIDARQMGTAIDRMHREIADSEIDKISGTYRAWRGDRQAAKYSDVPGFCKSAPLDEIRKCGYTLAPESYVGVEYQQCNDEPFEQKMRNLTLQWHRVQADSKKLDMSIAESIKSLGLCPEGDK